MMLDSTSIRRTALAIGATLALTVTASARAQSVDDKAAAEVLFDQGKSLMAARNYAEACPKLEESLRLDPGIGAMLYLAECYERNGQTASAWVEFREAAAAASRQGDAREKVARERAARLEPKLAKVSVVVPSTSDVPGLTVKRDGTALSKAVWGAELPVDPGAHTIAASAPNKQSWTTTVQVPATARVVSVTVPLLEQAPETVAPSSPIAAAEPLPAKGPSNLVAEAPAAAHDGKSQRIVGVVLMGAGVVGLGVGGVFGLQAKSKQNDSSANGHCLSDSRCDGVGFGLREDAKSAATVATISSIAGAAAVVGGAVVYLTAPRNRTPRMGLVPSMVPSGGALELRGIF